jgi:hypothetical protein
MLQMAKEAVLEWPRLITTIVENVIEVQIFRYIQYWDPI